MKKSILLSIVILIMIFGITNNVNASVIPTSVNYDLTLNNNSGWTKNNRNYIKEVNVNSNGWQEYLIELPSNLKTYINNYDYTYITASLVYTIGTNTLILNNVDFDTTCTQSHLENMVPDLQITYADGTHADIDGSTYEQICDSYHIAHYNNNITITETNRDKNPYFNVGVRKNSQNLTCEYLGQSLYKCPKYQVNDPSGTQYFIFDTYYNGSGGNYKIYLYEYLYFENKDSTEIINNQNQNTTTISNNITNLNDNITSDNVTGNNSNDSITSISNTFSSSNDFILNLFTLPYNFITTIMNGVSNSCTPISLGSIFDYELVMPCINLNNWLGNVWTTIVDVILAGMLSFAFRKRIHDFFFAVIRLDRNAANIGGVEIL